MIYDKFRAMATAVSDQVEATLRDMVIAMPPQAFDKLVASMNLAGKISHEPEHQIVLLAALHGLTDIVAKLADEEAGT